MEQNPTTKNNPRQAILLDLSLFILDLLDSKRIQENTVGREHILEVPSALVLMLRDSRVGSPILFMFVYSLLVKVIKKYKEKKITDQRIEKLVNSPDFIVRGDAWRITQQLFDEFSPLIDIAPKSTLPEDQGNPDFEYKSNNSDYPIRRYDSIGSFSYEDQKRLQEIYTRELNLPAHPLYDQYFSQVYHAQTIGTTETTSPLRRTVSLDDETFKVISNWKHEAYLDEKSKVVQANRSFLQWFISTYIKDTWKETFFDASMELSVAGVLTGSMTSSIGISLVTLAGGTIIKSIIAAPPEVLDPISKPFLIVAVIVIMFICLIIISGTSWFARRSLLAPIYTPTLLLPPATVFTQSATPFFSSTSTATLVMPSNTPAPTLAPIFPANLNNPPNYCLYVVQPGDTIQSVALWFRITEESIKNSDVLAAQNIFSLHQIIKVNAPCCTNFGINNGRSYSVQLKDNVYRLAIDNRITVEKIIEANNLKDSSYIKFGQMLCIPNP